MIKIQATIIKIYANKMVTTNLGDPVIHKIKKNVQLCLGSRS